MTLATLNAPAAGRLCLLAAAVLMVAWAAAPAHAQPVPPDPPILGESGALGIPSTFSFTDFAGAGFAPEPAAGQLSSLIFAVSGLTGGPLNFGETATDGQYAQGTSTGGVTSGGIYAYDGDGGPWLFVQPTGTAFNPGALTMRYENTTEETLSALDVSYDIKVFNDQPRSSTWNFSYSVDNATYVSVPALNYTSPGPEDASPTWQTVPRSTTVTGLSLQPGDHFYLRFTSADAGGGGARDEIGVDNVMVAPAGPGDPDAAFVQIIHNAPDTAIGEVDIRAAVNGGAETLLATLAFQEATGYLELSPGTYDVRLTPAGDAGSTLLAQTLEVPAGARLQVVALGVANPGQFPPNPDGEDTAARLLVMPDAQVDAPAGQTALNILHGSPTAPTVTPVDRYSGLDLAPPLSYGDFTGFTALPANEYLIDLVDDDGDELIGFSADLTGLAEGAATVIASGFYDLTAADGTHFALLAVLPDGTVLRLPYVIDIATARQLPLGSTVKVTGTVTRAMGAFTYLQDNTAGLAVRQTDSPWQQDVASQEISSGTTVTLTGRTSQFRGLFQINQASATVNDLISYEIQFQGQLPEPIVATLEDIAEDGESYESRLVHVPNLNTSATGTFAAATTYGVEDATTPPGIVDLRIPNAADTEVDGTPIPPDLFTFIGVVGQFTPTPTGPFDEGYQLLAILESDIQPQDEIVAIVQVVHNAPDPALDVVDIYLNGELALPSFDFRDATPFIPIPATVTVAIAPAGASGPGEAVFTETYDLLPETIYQLIASGVGEGDFSPNPDGADIALTLLAMEDARQIGLGGPDEVDVAVVHGAPDVGTVDISTELFGMPTILFSGGYGEMSDYLTVPADDYFVVVEGDGFVLEFQVDASGLGGEAVSVLASGFADPSAQPPGAPDLGLLVVFADGTTLFIEPFTTSAEDDAIATSFVVNGVFPNPASGAATISFDLPAEAEVTLEVFDVLGRRVQTLDARGMPPGAGHTLALDLARLAPGTYLWRLVADGPAGAATESGRLTVVR